MDIEAELDRVFCNLKNSAEALEGILYQSFEIPVDHWSKEKPEEIVFPNTGDKMQDINELLNIMEKNIEQTRVNIKQFELNRFQVIKEEEFDPRYSQPLIDYEIVQNVEQTKINRMKSNANRLRGQIAAYQQKQL